MSNKDHLPVEKTSELLSEDISRLGEDGDDNHLIEMPAIEFIHDATHKVNQVGIVHYRQTHYIREMMASPCKLLPTAGLFVDKT